MTTLPALAAVTVEVRVAVDPARAFAAFTTDVGRWWPVGSHSVGGGGSTVAFVDGRLVETTAVGGSCLWGTVTTWDPPHRLALTWHPGSPPDPCTQVEVGFAADGDGTVVTLVHTGWERVVRGAERRAEYATGWPLVLAGYRDAAS